MELQLVSLKIHSFLFFFFMFDINFIFMYLFDVLGPDPKDWALTMWSRACPQVVDWGKTVRYGGKLLVMVQPK